MALSITFCVCVCVWATLGVRPPCENMCVCSLGYIVAASPPLCVCSIGYTVGASPPCVCPFIWRRSSLDPCMLPTLLCGFFLISVLRIPLFWPTNLFILLSTKFYPLIAKHVKRVIKTSQSAKIVLSWKIISMLRARPPHP